MPTIRQYRLVSLTILVVAVLALFLGFFFLWVIAPVVAIGAFYLVYVWIEEQRARRNGGRTRRSVRRARLREEAQARDRDLAREIVR
jgi:predicted DNA repair protein MutK